LRFTGIERAVYERNERHRGDEYAGLMSVASRRGPEGAARVPGVPAPVPETPVPEIPVPEIPVPETPIPEIPGRPTLSALLRLARPKQWAKNALVFAAPLAAGVLDEPNQLGRTLVAFVALCLAASGTYFLNDAQDLDADRAHPTKRHRPVAAGLVTERFAVVASVVLMGAGVAVTIPINLDLTALIGGYVVLTISYSLWLKKEAVIDLGVVAAGFVIRAIAGGLATHVTISDWFLIVAGGASLFIVTGKRYAEQIELGELAESHRPTLTKYSKEYLSYVRAVASSLTITAYCLWAFENAARTGDELWFRLSIVPFVLGMLRYAHLIEQGRGGAPEEILLSDRVIQVLGVLWLVAFAVGVYA
jgi:decaprenyl-phosphate phosphoribosyltransferase